MTDETEMVYRMAEYMVMLLRKYRLPVEQCVLFMGAGKPRMATEINDIRLKYSYRMIALSEVDYNLFLKSEKTEEKILAILANFERDGEDLALHNILKSVQALEKSDFARNRYFEQLRILAHLRKLDIKFKEVMESISKFFKIEEDPFFRQGEAKGELNKAISIAIVMKKEGIQPEQIAKFTGLSIGEIKKL